MGAVPTNRRTGPLYDRYFEISDWDVPVLVHDANPPGVGTFDLISRKAFLNHHPEVSHSTHKRARNMPKEHTLATPEDVVIAWCGTQTSSLCEKPPHMSTDAQDILLCSFGATPRGGPPRADHVSLNNNTDAIAARQGIEFVAMEKTASGEGPDLSRSSSQTGSQDAEKKGQAIPSVCDVCG